VLNIATCGCLKTTCAAPPSPRERCIPSRYALSLSLLGAAVQADFSGSISDLISSYASDATDLIAQPHDVTGGSMDVAIPHDWLWIDCTSAAFAAAVPIPSRRAVREHAQRLSSRLLQYLREASRKGVVAESEMSVPSLARLGNFSWTSFRPEHVGTKFSFNTRLSQSEFDAEPPRRLYHAIKPGVDGIDLMPGARRKLVELDELPLAS